MCVCMRGVLRARGVCRDAWVMGVSVSLYLTMEYEE